jgi:high-affinity nickel permease
VFGLDELISGVSHGGNPAIVLGVALLLGLRHSTDPDHLVAVSTLVATDPRQRLARAARLGLAWGLGHATSLLALGLPFVLVAALLPRVVRQAAEVSVGLVIVALAIRLLREWRDGALHAHAHRHGHVVHQHLHPHAAARSHRHTHRVRSPLQAYGIGVLHGIGGSAGVAVLLLAGMRSRTEAVAALCVFVTAAAVSMATLSAGFGLALGGSGRLARAVPVLGAFAFAFGVCYIALAFVAA